MRRRSTRVLIGLGVVVATTAVALVPGAVAGARSASGPIGPDQTFVGLVNGRAVNATIALACPEAVRPGQAGHPVAGQTIGIASPAPSTAPGGFTGSRGRSIVAQFITPSAAAGFTVIFAQYGTAAIPTTPLLPCMGSGTIAFTVHPTSATARNETMVVTFVSPCAGICAGPRHEPS